MTLAIAPSQSAHGSSLRFYGNGVTAPTLDRVVIPLDDPARPIDVGAADLTIELFLRALAGSNGSTAACTTDPDAWINGNILLDRDVFGSGDYGDLGISLMNGRVAFGVGVGSSGATICGSADLRDGAWHHLAVTRRRLAGDGRPAGELRLFVDGVEQLPAVDGPDGDLSYRDDRETAFPWDPYLVLGAEKHDAGAAYPSFAGWLDEIRVSTVLRYTTEFEPPTAPFAADGSTAALFHLDEGSGNLIQDASGATGGPSDGERRVGGSPAGPEWSGETPFAAVFGDGFESGDTSAWTATIP